MNKKLMLMVCIIAVVGTILNSSKLMFDTNPVLLNITKDYDGDKFKDVIYFLNIYWIRIHLIK